MAFTGIKVDLPEIADLKRQLQGFPTNLAAKHLGAALRKASKPGETALKSEVRTNQRGPTGNLLRAVATKVVTYKRTGNAVAIVGFTKAGSAKSAPTTGTIRKGKDRAFHAGFLEFGTKDRRTKRGSIASSYKRLGPFTLGKVAKRGKFAGVVRVVTKPKYPKAFFKRARAGESVYLGRTQREAPVASSFVRSLGAMRTQLKDGIAVAVEKAGKDLANDFPPRGRP